MPLLNFPPFPFKGEKTPPLSVFSPSPFQREPLLISLPPPQGGGPGWG
jgi:hypothetical protein